jgi:hypothetical protein
MRNMATPIHELVTSYIQAVGEHRLEDLAAMLDPEAEFALGDTTYSVLMRSSAPSSPSCRSSSATTSARFSSTVTRRW